MLNFLRSLHFDRASFWLGFLAATLFWWLLLRLRPTFRRLLDHLRTRSLAAREDLLSSVEVRHRNETLRLAQQMHLAAPLFSLDEILLTPRVLAPPPAVDPGVPAPAADLAETVLPYLPAWPELGALYGYPTLTLCEALQGGSNLLLYGAPGSGKTVALAHLAVQAARKEAGLGVLEDRVPLLVLAGDLLPASSGEPDGENGALLGPLLAALSRHASRLTQPRLPQFIEKTLQEGRALLLVDGLDELPPEAGEAVSAYLASLLKRYPETRCVAAATPGAARPLAALGFAQLWMAAWDLLQRRDFMLRWSDLWTRLVAPPAAQDGSPGRTVDPLILNGWLLGDTRQYTPLELTLKVWGAYAGDLPGPFPADAIEAYVRRMTLPASGAGVKEAAGYREAAAGLAAAAALAGQPFPGRREAEAWIAGSRLPLAFQPEEQPAPDSPETGEPQSVPSAERPAERIPPVSAGQRLFSNWLSTGFLREQADDRLGFSHIEVAGYLAGPRLAAGRQETGLLEQPVWTGRERTLAYAAPCGGDWVLGQIPPAGEDPLYSRLLAAARWLRSAPQKASWRPGVIRQVVAGLQNESLALALRGEMLAAALASGTNGLPVVFRSALQSPEAAMRCLAALGCGAAASYGIQEGAQLEAKTTAGLAGLLADGEHAVRQAACLALAATGGTTALETLGAALLNGDDPLRQAAAQALANHPAEGHPMLADGASMEKTAVRRAAVSGLRRVRRPWARELLAKLQTDPQWVVQTAATQALEELDAPDPHIPPPLPPIHNLPWLIAFAGQLGMGVAPGKAALELLLSAIVQGDEEQRQAAMQTSSRLALEPAVLPVYRTYFGERRRLQDAAYQALHSLSLAGLPLPSPAQFDFR